MKAISVLAAVGLLLLSVGAGCATVPSDEIEQDSAAVTGVPQVAASQDESEESDECPIVPAPGTGDESESESMEAFGGESTSLAAGRSCDSICRGSNGEYGVMVRAACRIACELGESACRCVPAAYRVSRGWTKVWLDGCKMLGY